MEDSVKNLADLKVDNVHCSLIYSATYFLAEVYHDGQA